MTSASDRPCGELSEILCSLTTYGAVVSEMQQSGLPCEVEAEAGAADEIYF